MNPWSWGPLGLPLATHVWNTFIISTLGFVAQLETPREAGDYVSKCLRKAAYGPGNFFRTEDVQRLKSAYGFPGELKDFRKMAAAAMLRTARKETACEGGLSDPSSWQPLTGAPSSSTGRGSGPTCMIGQRSSRWSQRRSRPEGCKISPGRASCRTSPGRPPTLGSRRCTPR